MIWRRQAGELCTQQNIYCYLIEGRVGAWWRQLPSSQHSGNKHPLSIYSSQRETALQQAARRFKRSKFRSHHLVANKVLAMTLKQVNSLNFCCEQGASTTDNSIYINLPPHLKWWGENNEISLQQMKFVHQYSLEEDTFQVFNLLILHWSATFCITMRVKKYIWVSYRFYFNFLIDAFKRFMAFTPFSDLSTHDFSKLRSFIHPKVTRTDLS